MAPQDVTFLTHVGQQGSGVIDNSASGAVPLSAANANADANALVLGLPALCPAVVTLPVSTFLYYWNNHLWLLPILQPPDKYPIVLLAQRVFVQGIVRARAR